MTHRLFSCPHRVGYSECTVGNHVYHSRYLDMAEQARGEFFRSIGQSFLTWQDADVTFPVVEATLRYKAAARYDDLLAIRIQVLELERVRLYLRHCILHENGTLLVELDTCHACTSLSGRPCRIPSPIVESLQPYRTRD